MLLVVLGVILAFWFGMGRQEVQGFEGRRSRMRNEGRLVMRGVPRLPGAVLRKRVREESLQ